MKAQTQKPKPIFPPGLNELKQNFELRFETLFKSPVGRRKPLIIMGDRGVGKSVFRDIFENRYLENNSNLTRKQNIRKLNASVFPKELIASELFGTMKGAYTGATNRAGFFETIGEDGLLILEEIGDMPQEAQAKLLTVIEDGQYNRQGSTDIKNTNAQIIGTTNKKSGAFREDFFDRFHCFNIPPLYERRQDILDYFRDLISASMETLSKYEVLQAMAYHWPGNVREIENQGDEYKFLRKKHKEVHFGKPSSWLLTRINIPEYKEVEKILNVFNLSLNYKDTTPAFKDIPKDFNREFEGLKIFCQITDQNINANYNLLDPPPRPKSIKNQVDIYSMPYNKFQERMNEIEKTYFQKLLKQADGNKSEAARIAEMGRTNLIKKLKKLLLI